MDEVQKAVVKMITSDVRKQLGIIPVDDELDIMPDEMLNELFAVAVCGYEPGWSCWPDFCNSADAVLPWLERAGYKCAGNRAGDTCATTIAVLVGERHVVAQVDYETTQNTFARAGVIALIRAKRMIK